MQSVLLDSSKCYSSAPNISLQPEIMERSKSVKIRYTANAFTPAPPGLPPEVPLLSYSRDDEPLTLQNKHSETGTGTDPIIEIVTALDTVNQQVDRTSEDTLQMLRRLTVTNIRNTLMIVHSAVLSQTIRDMVEYYPR